MQLYRDASGTLPAFAWPGGYPVRYYTGNAYCICPKCANDPTKSDPPITCDIAWEGPEEACDDCGAMMPTAYGDPEAVDG